MIVRFFVVLQSVFLKKEKKIFLKKMQASLKLFYIARDRRKTLKKEEEKMKNEKKSNDNHKYIFFTFTFLYRKIYILLENKFRKT